MRFPLLILILFLTLGGCAQQSIQRKDGGTSAREFTPANLAKGDVDLMTEMSQREVLKSLRLLTEKLYKRNPQEFRKSGLESAEAATARLFDELAKWPDSPLVKLNWEESFRLALLESYGGDRVHLFMSAMVSMVMAAYDHKNQFFLGDALSAQKLYNSARNVEVAVWKLSSAQLAGGAKVLVSNTLDKDAPNLSFEREFGKVIAVQDLLALIIEDRGNRTISRILQGAAFIFLPI